MAKEFVVKLSVDSSGAVDGLDKVTEEIVKTEESTKNLKQQLRALQVEMQDLDPNDAKFQELSRQAAELKDRIDDTAQAIRDNAGNAFEGLSNNAATLGGRLLDLDFAGVGQSARGMAANIKNINVKLLTEEVGGAIKGFAQLGKALLTNPIFLIGAAIAAIIVNFESLKGYVDGVSSEMTENLEIAKEALQVEKAKSESLAGSENILRLQGKSERDILNMKIAQLQAEISKAEVVNAQMDGIAEAQIQAAERNKGIIVGILQFLAAPFQLIAKQIDNISEGLVKIGVLDSSFGLSDKLTSGIDSLASMVFDPEEVRKQAAAAKKASDDELRNMRNALAGHQLAIQAIDKRAADERKAANQQAADEQRVRQSQAANSELTEIKSIGDQKLQLATTNAQSLVKIEADKESQLSQLVKKSEEERLAMRKQNIALGVQFAADGLQAVAALNEAFAGQSKKSQERAFKINKAFSIAQALISTYQGVNTQLAVPQDQLTGANFVKAGIILATGIANVAKIAKTKFDGGTTPPGGTGPGPLASTGAGGVSASPPSFNPLDLRTLQNRPPQTSQTYVLAGQVSNAQDANERIKRLAKLG